VENAADVIVRFSGDLRIISANPAVERLTGIGAASLIGKTSSDLRILEPLLPTWELILGQVWRTGREQHFELTVRSPRGERVFDSRIAPEPSSDGSVQSLLTISSDITERRRAEAERLELYQQVVAQQNRMQELMGRVAWDRGSTPQRTVSAGLLENLNDRELRILRLLAEGWTNRQIGAEIGLTMGSVKNKVAHILSKLNVTDRTQAAVRAAEYGLVERGD
jgi:PAS domain S-box-containing protein